MKRTQISLESEERELLDAETRRTGRSMSALVRDAVRIAYAPKDDPAEDISRLRAGFGAWADAGDRGDDGAEYVERLRTGTRWADLPA
ncbi:MAG TPA: ribbon-helix-helix protein, CopG family [Microbacterium sp.]|nr:ribbon-helix-helix protein, CopG family [Microbacterium sp.]